MLEGVWFFPLQPPHSHYHWCMTVPQLQHGGYHMTTVSTIKLEMIGDWRKIKDTFVQHRWGFLDSMKKPLIFWACHVFIVWCSAYICMERGEYWTIFPQLQRKGSGSLFQEFLYRGSKIPLLLKRVQTVKNFPPSLLDQMAVRYRTCHIHNILSQ